MRSNRVPAINMNNTVEKHIEEKDCRCAKCRKLLFRIEINVLHVNLQIDELRNRKLSIKCDRCERMNTFNVMRIV